MVISRLSLKKFSIFSAFVAGALVIAATPAFAQPKAAAPAAAQQKKDKLLVEANELVYNKETDTVSANGNAQLYYQGKTLEADKVTYNRQTKRVFAEGNARITEANGTKYYGDKFELTDDFKNGFIDSLRSETPDKQRFSAARGERTEGETSVFDRGTYTACEPCKDNPSKPPLWQVRAARIIHKTGEQMMYYEQATLEFWGVPIAYFPVFSTPDPTVTRKSGFLAPRYVSKKGLGYGAEIPYFWVVAPNMDVTFSPMFLSNQGFLGQAEWRHRLETGSYNLRIAGISQNKPAEFLPSPLGAGDKKFRGSIESTGLFYLNDKWKWGWDLAGSTDKFFFSNYKVRTESLANSYFRESVSTLFLNGQGERSWFDMRGYYFRPLTSLEWQRQQAKVHPVLDYDRRFSNPFIGGEIALTANVTSLSRDAAQYQALPNAATIGPVASPSLFVGTTRADSKGKTYYVGLYEGCTSYNPANCILRGIAGDYTRASVALSWRRSFIDPIGQVWTPFASLRTDVAVVGLKNSTYSPAPNSIDVYGNDKQRFFLGDNTDMFARVMPMTGLEYRYPLIAQTGSFTHQLEPIAQIMARPNETKIGQLPNEDAQSLVFDDTVLFSPNKFSGYDRIEGGLRVNYGGQYTVTSDKGAYANLLFGQSVQLSGRNSFAQRDMINTGLDSGLETKRSDYVGRVSFAPSSALNLSLRGRFDEKSFALRRLEASATANFGALTLSSTYARIAPQPLLGHNLRREGLYNSAYIRLPNNWYVSGGVLFDMDRYLSDRAYHLAYPNTYPRYNNTPFRISSSSLSVGYRDECTDFSLSWSRSVNDYVTGTKTTGSVYMFRLELKHHGQTQYRTTTGNASVQDITSSGL